LRAGHANLAVEDEKRNPSYARGPRFHIALQYPLAIYVAGKISRDLPAIESGARRHVSEDLPVRQVRALDEVGTEQLLRQRVLFPRPLRIVQKPVRVEGVGLDLHLLVGKGDADLAPRCGYARVNPLAASAELALDILLARYPVLRKVWVQLERQPAHGGLRFIGMAFAVALERPLELALPDETPGSDHGRYDIDLKRLVGHNDIQ